MDQLRKPLFLIAVALLALAVLVELAIRAVLPERTGVAEGSPTPGFGISYLALVDGLLLFTMSLMTAALFVPERVQGKVQGCLTALVALAALLLALVLIVMGILLFALMTGLLFATPFGTLAYLALFGDFPREEARVVLSLLMSLKLGFAGCLLFAHQRFLQNKGLILLIVTSLVANIVVSFLHGFVPRVLASITDVVAAIVVAVLALIWAIFFLVGGLVSVVKVLRVDKAL